MPANRVPTLATLGRPVFQDIGDGIAFLPSSGKTRDRRIPYDFARLERAYLTQSNPPVPSPGLRVALATF